jgi:hypothetical protein
MVGLAATMTVLNAYRIFVGKTLSKMFKWKVEIKNGS